MKNWFQNGKVKKGDFTNMNYNYISVEKIKKEYHLDVLCPPNTTQKENIALTIRAVYFYEEIMRELEKTDDEVLKAINRKTMMMLSYSVIDGVVACLGFKMQNQCYNCRHRCSHYCVNMFSKSAEKNLHDSFKNADAFLKKNNIINLDRNADLFYNQYRDIRNNIHLTKNVPLITRDAAYSKRHVDYSTTFMDNFIDMLYHNYINFINVNKCINRR